MNLLPREEMGLSAAWGVSGAFIGRSVVLEEVHILKGLVVAIEDL